jgi:hypothetical protein
VKLSDGLIVAGAHGWCVDRKTTRSSGAASVVVFGSCAAIAGNARAPSPAFPGVVTVLVDGLAETAPPAALLEQFFASNAGRAALARDGRADSVTIIETYREGELLFLHAEDRSAGRLPDESGEYWRALFDMNGRFVTVSLVGLANRPIPRAAGLAALTAQIDQLKNANDV